MPVVKSATKFGFTAILGFALGILLGRMGTTGSENIIAGPESSKPPAVAEKAFQEVGRLTRENKALQKEIAGLRKTSEETKSRPEAPLSPPSLAQPGLASRLNGMRAWYLKAFSEAREQEAALKSDPEATQEYRNRMLAALGKEMKGLRAGILDDPRSFLVFLKTIDDPQMAEAMLGMLSQVECLGDDMFMFDCMKVDALPRSLADGFLDLLKTGSPAQKQAVLKSLKGQMLDESWQVLACTALQDADAGVRAAALPVVGCMGPAIPKTLQTPLLQAAQSSPPGSEQDRIAMGALAWINSPQSIDYLLTRLERDPAGASSISGMLRNRCQSPDLAARYASALGTAFSGRLEPGVFYDYVIQSAELPPDRAIPLLERALQAGPPPKLKAAIDKAMACFRQNLPMDDECRHSLNTAHDRRNDLQAEERPPLVPILLP